MSFWRTFPFHTISAIDNILDRESFSLEDLLGEEDILQETKAQNKKLIDYLSQPTVLGKLFEYVTVPPPPNADAKRVSKYPFLACEILCSEVWTLCETIYEHEQFLDQLYSFLNYDPPIPLAVSIHASKVAGVLLQKKVQETVNYLRRKDVVSKFLNHLEDPAIMDLLLKVISCEVSPESGGLLEILSEKKLIEILIEKFDAKYDAETHENVSQALVDIIIISSHAATHMSSPLLEKLENPTILHQLFYYILDQDSKSAMQQATNVVIELLKKNSNTEYKDEVPPVLNLVLQKVQRFVEILVEKPARPIPSTVGQLLPFGIHRLKIVELFVALVKTNYQVVDEALLKLKIFNACLNVFFDYEWNNFLHAVVEQLIFTALESENLKLKLALLRDCQLPDLLANAYLSDEKGRAANPKTIRKGFMGHLINMCFHVVNAAKNSEELQRILDDNQTWTNFTNGPLAEIKPFYKKPTNQRIFPQFDSSIDDHDFDNDQGNADINAFTQYFMPDGFSQQFPDEFTNDDDYNEEEGDLGFDNDRVIDGSYSTDEKKFGVDSYEDEEEEVSDESDESDYEDDAESEEEDRVEGDHSPENGEAYSDKHGSREDEDEDDDEENHSEEHSNHSDSHHPNSNSNVHTTKHYEVA